MMRQATLTSILGRNANNPVCELGLLESVYIEIRLSFGLVFANLEIAVTGHSFSSPSLCGLLSGIRIHYYGETIIRFVLFVLLKSYGCLLSGSLDRVSFQCL
jgi:hypothetical protein